MGSVRLNTNSFGLKSLAELNYHSRDDHKEVRDGVVGEGQGLSEEDELRINELAEDITDRREGKIPRQPVLQEQDPQPQGLVDRWERFLPLRSLKVLLVENDDSTRQVVSALLRNCSYEVTAASNGLQAWKILEDENNHIDLVLTEVVMPCLSGIGLLCKIMNHITRKNIPVIMMSSHDSMGIVFKCLSKGAVDFLVKPIRKNELKNLWQHVWRRCHSSCGSGSESGIQTQKSAKSKSIEDSDINAGSNDDDDNGSIGLNVRDGSDNGSGTQSSWTKRAIEIDSPEPMSPCEQFADPHDSTCAQVIHPKPVTVCNDWVPMISAREHQEQKEQPIENVVMGIDLEIGVPTKLDLHLDSSPSEKVSTNQAGRKRDEEQVNTGSIKPDNSNPSGKPVSLAADLIGVIAHRQMGMGIVAETPNSLSRSSEIEDKSTFEAKDLPFLELSLKRLRSAGDSGTASNDERTVLRRSDMSAFSRYHTAVAAIQTPTGYGGSCCPLDNGSEAVKTESMHNLPSNSNAAALLKQGSNGSNNNNYMGSATKNVFCKPASTSAPKCLHPSSAFQPVQLCCTCAPQQAISEKADDVASAAVALGQPRVAQHQIHVQHHLCCHHHNHHIHGMLHQQKQQLPPDPDELALKNMAAAAPQCRSSNVFGGTADGNTGNYSLNGSMSGSNHGSNGQNGSGSGSGSGVDQNRFAQRVAALTKFRQKRKERCFEKKVRYQSRKRLAEQRPRVRGQFVRQIVYEHSSRDSDF